MAGANGQTLNITLRVWRQAGASAAGAFETYPANDIPVDTVNKVLEGRPHIVDAMQNGDIQLVFNTTEGATSIADSYSLRRTALNLRIPYYTTVAGARAAVASISALRSGALEVAPLQSYFSSDF